MIFERLYLMGMAFYIIDKDTESLRKHSSDNHRNHGGNLIAIKSHTAYLSPRAAMNRRLSRPHYIKRYAGEKAIYGVSG
ncbi:MAG: hypothetical protein C0593_10225 [Marinilabiliales bacterium]|nr:MAG: hypothetical protein C0593_10225 [Marinilabiliales bacterium]